MERKFVFILGSIAVIALAVVGGLYLRRSSGDHAVLSEAVKDEDVVVNSETKLPLGDVSFQADRVAKVMEIVQIIDAEIKDDEKIFEKEQNREMTSLRDGGELVTELGASYDESKY